MGTLSRIFQQRASPKWTRRWDGQWFNPKVRPRSKRRWKPRFPRFKR